MVRELARVTLLLRNALTETSAPLPLSLVLTLFSGAVFMTLMVKAVWAL